MRAPPIIFFNAARSPKPCSGSDELNTMACSLIHLVWSGTDHTVEPDESEETYAAFWGVPEDRWPAGLALPDAGF